MKSVKSKVKRLNWKVKDLAKSVSMCQMSPNIAHLCQMYKVNQLSTLCELYQVKSEKWKVESEKWKVESVIYKVKSKKWKVKCEKWKVKIVKCKV